MNHNLKLYVACGIVNNRYIEEKFQARSQYFVEQIIKINFPEWKDVQVVEAEDFEYQV